MAREHPSPVAKSLGFPYSDELYYAPPSWSPIAAEVVGARPPGGYGIDELRLLPDGETVLFRYMPPAEWDVWLLEIEEGGG